MKLVHLSDLHLGKRVNEFSMLEDQKHILWEILRIIGQEKPEGVIIAGDVYDKAVPPAEAVALLDEFLVRLAGMRTEVFIISGNHDSAERQPADPGKRGAPVAGLFRRDRALHADG